MDLSRARLRDQTLRMPSIEFPNPATLDYGFDLVWGETDGDVAILPNFFEQAYQALQKLIAGVDELQLARARRLGVLTSSSNATKKQPTDFAEEHTLDSHGPLAYRRRETDTSRSMPIPRLKLLGEGTTDAAKLVPRLKSAINELPSMSHRFVTLPLEEGMDL